MPKIYSLNEPFDLDQLKLANPVSKNGSHFIKSLAGEDPLYFLAPKCFVKQGFVSHGKKIFCDFVFSTEDRDFLAWMENLEEIVRANLYTNREKWFETPLDEHDIESSLAAPYKSYKSGKYFIVRANVPTALGKINIKIYDEHEKETEPENIKENTNVMVVLEFQGIRCSVRSFQFEIVLKQMLVVEPEKLFEKCIIPKSAGYVKDVSKKTIVEEDAQEKEICLIPNSNPTEEIIKENVLIEESSSQLLPVVLEKEEEEDAKQSLDTEISVDPNEPVEVVALDLITEDSEPPIQLKKRNDVYYKLYKDARLKAREAKQIALANYLEAKRIKNTYLLEDMTESDEDDAAILESDSDGDYDE